jgi:hypothetical protein
MRERGGERARCELAHVAEAGNDGARVDGQASRLRIVEDHDAGVDGTGIELHPQQLGQPVVEALV